MKKNVLIFRKYLIYSGLLLIVIASVGIRWPLLDVPLEHDEGEYAYAGQLILQGIPPYKLIYNMKLPGIYGIYALLLASFGQTHKGIHFGLLLINTATIIIIFFLARRLINSMTGISVAACFALLSVGQSVQGVFANSEHFVIFFALSSALLLLKGTESNQILLLFFSGMLAGLGFLVKQHGAAFMVFGFVFLITEQIRGISIPFRHFIYRIILFSIGAVLPYVFTCIFLYIMGVFDKFWFWTVNYAIAYTTQTSLNHAFNRLLSQTIKIVQTAPLIWTISLFGFIALFVNKNLKSKLNYIFLFFIFSFIAICPGFYFRPHYFILILPVTAILAGVGTYTITNILEKTPLNNNKTSLSMLILIICIGASLFQQRSFLFQMTPKQACKSIYGLNPFSESIEINQVIQTLTQKDDRIVVLGSEPQIYFYSNRRSATGYIYMYPMMEVHEYAKQMQIEMIKEIEAAEPEVLIIVNVYTSWLSRPNSNKQIFEWLDNYHTKHYSMVGLIEITMNKTSYYWLSNIEWPPKSKAWMLILKRKKN